MVGDQHHRARPHVRIDRAGGIGEDQLRDAEAGKHLQRRPHRRRVAVLVIVSAAGQHQHRRAGKTSRHHLAGMAGDAASGKARQFGIGNADSVLDLVDKPAKARTQHQRGGGRQPVQPFDETIKRFLHVNQLHSKTSSQHVALKAVGQHLAHGQGLDHAAIVAKIELGFRPAEFGQPLPAAAAG